MYVLVEEADVGPSTIVAVSTDLDKLKAKVSFADAEDWEEMTNEIRGPHWMYQASRSDFCIYNAPEVL